MLFGERWRSIGGRTDHFESWQAARNYRRPAGLEARKRQEALNVRPG